MAGNELTKLLDAYKLTKDELKHILRSAKAPKTTGLRAHKVPAQGEHIRYGVISDTHMGHKNYRPDILADAAKTFTKEGVEFIVHAGDILEGMSGRDGHIYELAVVGATNQVNYAVKQLSQFKQKIYAITAECSHDGWFSSKGSAGFEVGPTLEDKLGKRQFEFLGTDEQDLVLGNGLRIRLLHPGGGSGYAMSYMGQQYVRAIAGGSTKPNIIHSGHHHKSIYFQDRNIHYFECPSMEEQTIFMRKKKSQSHLGYMVMDVWVGKQGGVNSIAPRFYTYYQ
jgi:predicted phosphodiesterase